MIRLQNIEKVYRTDTIETLALNSVSLDIAKGEFLSIMGPSGCGKTTFLRGINRMHELIPGATAKGKIMLNNEDVLELAGDGNDDH